MLFSKAEKTKQHLKTIIKMVHMTWSYVSYIFQVI